MYITRLLPDEFQSDSGGHTKRKRSTSPSKKKKKKPPMEVHHTIMEGESDQTLQLNMNHSGTIKNLLSIKNDDMFSILSESDQLIINNKISLMIQSLK